MKKLMNFNSSLIIIILVLVSIVVIIESKQHNNININVEIDKIEKNNINNNRNNNNRRNINTGGSLLNDKNIKTSESYYLQEWDVISPFPLSDREEGADVLEAFGGIRGIPRADQSTYPTDLTDDGRAGWVHITTGGIVAINYNESVGGVNWPLIEAWGGETASFFGGWGLADFELQQEEIVIVQCSGIAKFFVDDLVMVGDAYGLNWAYASATLQAGNHTVYARITGSEGFEYSCSVQIIDTDQSPPLMVVDDVVVPDVVNGVFASSYVSVTVLNLLNSTVDIVNAEIQSPFTLQLFKRLPIEIGQLTPLFMVLTSQAPITCTQPNNLLSIPITLSTNFDQYVPFVINFTCKSFGDAYTFTFLDYDQSVQYAAAQPPAHPPCPSTGCPVLLTMHGAGVDAKSTAWTGAYQRQNNSWLLFPTNRRPYGWDWQGPGLKNAFAALDALSSTLPGVPSAQAYRFGADQTKLLYAGHSMGGHGCWHVATHYPDLALAVAPAAGWIDYQTYLPFFLRVADSWTDPFFRFLQDASISEHNVDMYTPHLAGIPLLARFGTIDNNVPPYHLRRMVRLVDEITRNTTAASISAIPGEGHWFNGVVDDAIMQSFFNAHITSPRPSLPQQFTVLTLNPASSGSRGGIQILQLGQPARIGKLRVVQTSSTLWTIQSQNVRRFAFVQSDIPHPAKLVVDGDDLNYVQYAPQHYCSDGQGSGWQTCSDTSWLFNERQPLTYGPIVQVLQAPLMIVYGTSGNYEQEVAGRHLATYISNALYYQDRFAISVLPDTAFTRTSLSIFNVILIGGPKSNSASNSLQSTFPVTYPSSHSGFEIGGYTFNTPSTGITFLAPCSTSGGSNTRSGCLLAVIDGTDAAGLTKAATQLFPLKSAIAIPDFAVAGPSYGYSGSAGLLALGFWDNNWQFDATNSYVSFIQN